MSGSGTRRENSTNKPPKVVIINTQYVETDIKGFKNVVQKLTGKDSKVEDDGDDGQRALKRWSDHNDNAKQFESSTSSSSHRMYSSYATPADVRTLTRDISFKEIERLLRDMPPIDEM
ncbi:VQ motif-containing protein 1 [Humulus lupulus]|uniref:VQ motif-containing protein 1 n=1 Tax=Humulus lupulus TaxID=3486 RepID=UPI002B40AA30|nr:VQ motif-containing protein 1 [Humulus lupulus]